MVWGRHATEAGPEGLGDMLRSRKTMAALIIAGGVLVGAGTANAADEVGPVDSPCGIGGGIGGPVVIDGPGFLAPQGILTATGDDTDPGPVYCVSAAGGVANQPPTPQQRFRAMLSQLSSIAMPRRGMSRFWR